MIGKDPMAVYPGSHWMPRRTLHRLLRVACAVIFSLIATSILYIAFSGSPICPSFPSALPFLPRCRTQFPTYAAASWPPHIPKKIWQISLPVLKADVISPDSITSFITHSPSHSYTALDADGAQAVLDRVAASDPQHSNISSLYAAVPRTVMRADFLRYLVLATEGGIYSDADTVMLHGLAHWVPEEFKNRTKLVVGIEADSGHGEVMIPRTKYRVQFCQWTMAGAAGHPVFWRMVDRMLAFFKEFEESGGQTLSDWDVLQVGGPVAWTEVLYGYMSESTGTELTWEDLTGMRTPRLLGDVLVLPVDGFATGVRHSGASRLGANKDGTMVFHLFKNSWRGESQ